MTKSVTKSVTKISVMLFLFLVTGLCVAAWAQAPPATNPGTTEQWQRAMLEEVRMLRVTMQQMTGNNLRTRIVLDQLTRQQGRVESLSEEIKNLKAIIQQAQDPQRGADELQEMEAQIRECQDPQERARLMQSYNAYKRTLERERAALQKAAIEHQNDLQQCENSLRMEQAKLVELQGQLEKLDQELERLASTPAARR